VHAITEAAAVDGEALQNVRVREHFTLLSVSTSELDSVLASDPQIDGQKLVLTRLG